MSVKWAKLTSLGVEIDKGTIYTTPWLPTYLPVLPVLGSISTMVRLLLANPSYNTKSGHIGLAMTRYLSCLLHVYGDLGVPHLKFNLRNHERQ